MRLCFACHQQEVPPRCRKYCFACSKTASMRWKRQMRRDARQGWLSGESSTPPWLDGWNSHEARKKYYRTYMQNWRAQRRSPTRCVAA